MMSAGARKRLNLLFNGLGLVSPSDWKSALIE
jgi:hypothetical protein